MVWYIAVQIHAPKGKEVASREVLPRSYTKMLKKYNNTQSLAPYVREGCRLKLATPTIHSSLDLAPCD